MSDVKETAERISTEHEEAFADREWWREAGNALGLDLRGWTYRDVAAFADRDTGRSVELPGSVAKRVLAFRHADAQEGGEAQCCMCGKKGLSTIEGDGGTECQLEDGRWTCSQDCYYTAVDWFSRPSAAPSNPVVSDADLRSFAETVDLIAEGDFYKDYDRAIAAIEPMRRILSALSVNPQSGSDKP